MKTLRRIVFWIHLATALTAGLVILVMCVTGILLAFEPQLVDYAERHLRTVSPPTVDARRLPIDELVARAQAARPDAKPTAIGLRAEPHAVVRISFGRDDVVGINPNTGDVVGHGSKTHAVMHVIEDWHRWLGSRDQLRPITGAANLAFMFLAVSGLYLWWPRTWTPAAVRAVTLFDPRLSGRARDFNWHNTVGLWCAPVLIVLTLTGVVMSFQWANDLLYVMTGNTPPPPPGARPSGDRAPRDDGRRTVAGGASLETLALRAASQVGDWDRIMLRLPQRPGGPVTAFIVQEPSWGPIPRSQLTLDPITGAVLRWEPSTTASLGRKLRTWVRYLHTGEAFGVLGQLIAGVASAGGVLLIWTGFALAWRRFRAWRPLRARTVVAVR
jgi:uncharacterized iron-regulated membrane protein